MAAQEGWVRLFSSRNGDNMKRILLGIMAVFTGMALAIGEADAAKVGGGRSIGTQRNITKAPTTTPPRQAAPQTAPANQPAPAPQSALSRWAPMLGGLAIGGLLGSMFSGGGGMGGAIGSLLMMALLGFAVFFVIRLLMRGRQQ